MNVLLESKLQSSYCSQHLKMIHMIGSVEKFNFDQISLRIIYC
jgi:hypothetical protein